MKKIFIILKILFIIFALNFVKTLPSFGAEKLIEKFNYKSEPIIVTDNNIIETYAEAIEKQNEYKDIIDSNKSISKTYNSLPNSLREQVISGIRNVETSIVYENYIVENVPLEENSEGSLYMDLSETRNEISTFFRNLFDEIMLNPEIFYLNGWEWEFCASGEITGENTAKANLTITLTPFYQMTADEVQNYNEKINQTVDYYLSGIDDSMTDLVKIIYTNNFICMRTIYDEELYNSGETGYNASHTMIGPLVNGLSVCDGYSNAFKYLLSKVGIEANLVVSTQLDHAWNHVKYNNQYYNIDVTFNDTTDSENIQTNYKYFMLSDNKFKTNDLGHYATDWKALEQATSTVFDSTNTAWKDYSRYLACYGENVYKIKNNNIFEVWLPEGTSASSSVTCDTSSLNNAIAYYKDSIFILGTNTQVYRVKISDLSKASEFCILPESASYLDYVDGKLYYNIFGNTSLYVEAELEVSYAELTLPDTVTNLTEDYFADKKIVKFIIPDSNVGLTVEDNALKNAKIEEIVIGTRLSTIPLNFVKENSNLKKITIGDGVLRIESSAFAGLENLEQDELVIPSSVEFIGSSAFSGLKVSTIKIETTKAEYGNSVFYFTEATKVVLPEGMKEIPQEMFCYALNIEEINLPSTIEKVGYEAFSYLSYDKEEVRPFGDLEITETMKSISSLGFKGMRFDTVKIASINTTIQNMAFLNSTIKCLILPEGMTQIKAGPFDNANIEKMRIPESVTTIDDNAFTYVNGLNTICGKIGSYAETYANEHNLNFVADVDVITAKETVEKEDSDGNPIKVIELDKATASLKNDVATIITEENFPILADKNVTIVVKDKSGNAKTGTDRIGTRCVITVYDEKDNVLAEYTIAINGDIDGDGRARIFDSFTILEDTFDNYDYDDIDYMTRDYDKDGKIRIFDAFSYLEDAI